MKIFPMKRQNFLILILVGLLLNLIFVFKVSAYYVQPDNGYYTFYNVTGDNSGFNVLVYNIDPQSQVNYETILYNETESFIFETNYWQVNINNDDTFSYNNSEYGQDLVLFVMPNGVEEVSSRLLQDEIDAENYLWYVYLSDGNTCLGENSYTGCTTFPTSETPTNTGGNSMWGDYGFFSEDYQLTDMKNDMVASVQATSSQLWPLMVFVGISLAFVIFLQVVVFTKRSYTIENKKEFNHKKAGELKEFYSKTGKTDPRIVETIKRIKK